MSHYTWPSPMSRYRHHHTLPVSPFATAITIRYPLLHPHTPCSRHAPTAISAHKHTHTHTRTHTYTYTHPRTHTHTHTPAADRVHRRRRVSRDFRARQTWTEGRQRAKPQDAAASAGAPPLLSWVVQSRPRHPEQARSVPRYHSSCRAIFA